MSTSKRLRPSIVLLSVAAFLLLFASLLLAAESKKATVLADTAKSVKEGEIWVTTFSKGIFTQDDSTFTADTVVVRSQTKDKVSEFTCTGNPVFTDPENKITADKVLGKSAPRLANFVGHVVMVSTPKKKEKTANGDVREKISGEPTTTTCDDLLYNYSKKVGIAKGHVVVKQKNRTVWADEATYEKSVELVTLRGNIRMKNTGEEELKELKDAETVTISLDNDWIDIVAKQGGKIEMIFDVPEEESSEPAAKDAGAKENGGKK